MVVENVTTQFPLPKVLKVHHEADSIWFIKVLCFQCPGNPFSKDGDGTDFHHNNHIKGHAILEMGLTCKNDQSKVDIKQLANCYSK